MTLSRSAIPAIAAPVARGTLRSGLPGAHGTGRGAGRYVLALIAELPRFNAATITLDGLDGPYAVTAAS